MSARLAPVTLLAGIAVAVGTVAVHQWWWGLLLAAAATLLVLVATPPGWATRLPLALGFVGRWRCWRCRAERATTWSHRPAPATQCSGLRWSCSSCPSRPSRDPARPRVGDLPREKRQRSDSCSYSEPVRRTRRRGVGHEGEGGQAVVLILLVVLVLGVGGWVAAYAGANGRVPRGTTVAGVEIGGREPTAAAAALARGIQHDGEEPITVAVGTVTTQVAPDAAGLSIDFAATVAKAVGPRSWDPRALWRYYGGGDELAPVVHVDYRKLDGLLDALDELAGQPARDAGISLSGGQISLTKPQNGVQIDQDHAREALVDTYAAGLTTVRLPLLLSQPDVDQADLDNALTTIANPAVSGPVTLGFAGSQVTLAPRQYADLLSLVDKDGALTLDVDSAGLAALVNPSAQDTEPVDATVALQNGAPAVVNAVAGQTYDEAGVTAAFLQGVTADGAARTVPVKGASKTKASFTTKDAKQLGVIEPVASFTVSVPSTVGPAFNDAVNRLSGALLRPGDTFSFNGRVGAVNGSAARLATATWNAGFLAGLTDVVRAASPTYTDGLPEGRDARVDAATDLQMRNDSSYGVLLSARLVPGGSGAPGSVVVDAWSTKEFEVSASTTRALCTDTAHHGPEHRPVLRRDPRRGRVHGRPGAHRHPDQRRDSGAQRHRDHDLSAGAGRGLSARRHVGRPGRYPSSSRRPSGETVCTTRCPRRVLCTSPASRRTVRCSLAVAAEIAASRETSEVERPRWELRHLPDDPRSGASDQAVQPVGR